MKPGEMTGSAVTLMAEAGGPALVADRIAGEWAANQNGGGREYKISPVPEELLRYHNNAQAAGEIVVCGEVIRG